MTALLTGARVGELAGLTWDDVDLAAGCITIRRSVSWARRPGDTGPLRPRYYEPKTASGRRTIPIAPELMHALKVWKLQSPPKGDGLVFAKADGTPRHRTTIAYEGLRPALKRAGLRSVTLHSLRHTYASTLILGGHAVTEVAALLGHKKPTVTLEVYSHWFHDLKTDARHTVARMLFQKSGSKLVAAAGSEGGSKPAAVS